MPLSEPGLGRAVVSPVIAALQLPAFRPGQPRSMAWYEDFLISNALIFAEAGITAIKVQDETREVGAASFETVARMSALCRTLRAAVPQLRLGIIVQAHDAIAPLAIADACGAAFVRLKVFVGAAVNSDGMRPALNIPATQYRAAIGRPDLKIYADVHDRTAVPLAPIPNDMAALWAQQAGADALVITGSGFDDTLARIASARAAGVVRPILIGGGITTANVAQALGTADGVVVSTALLRDGAAPDAFDLWDRDKTLRFADAARRAVPNL